MGRKRELDTFALLALVCAPAWPCQETEAEPAPAPAPAQPPADEEEGSRWIDPQDGWFDLSSFLEQPHGFVPLLVPITEPAVGYGLAAAAVFLDPRESAGSEGWARPNITLVGGMRTENDSQGLFAANSTLWGDGDLQTLIAGGKLTLELELHGIGDDPELDDDPLDYGLDAEGIIVEGRVRLGDTSFWAALRFAYAETTVDFDQSAAGVPGVDPGDDDVTIAGPTLTLRYDSLDNVFSPTSGTLSDTTVSFFDEAFGGSQDFQRFQQVLIRHWPLSEKFFLGARGDFQASFGDTPFYARPYIALRGVPALRYQGEDVAAAELELRWQLHPRFSLVGFGGGGLSWTEFEEFEREQSAFSGGVGVRYLLARKFGLHVGLDVAHGPEEGAIYVQFGSAWARP